MKSNQSPEHRIPFYQVDAFASEAFSGNPAAVCLLESWLDDKTLQKIAQENNLSETAFVVKQGENLALRWFTPAVEVDLCGHATLAAAFAIFHRGDTTKDVLHFHTRSGELIVRREDDFLSMDFPQTIPELMNAPPAGLLSALGIEEGVLETWKAFDYVIVLDDERRLDALSPDFAALKKFNTRGVVVTASSAQFDFRSRWFGPQIGVNEDPVTGSAHTFLAPLWAKKLSKDILSAQQGGDRKGEILCKIKDEGRVELSGKSRLIIEGMIFL